MELNVLTLRHGGTVAKIAIRKTRALLNRLLRRGSANKPAVGDAHSPNAEPAPGAEAPPDSDFIDVREWVATLSMADLIDTAEKYFSGLKDWTYHLAKPFATPGDAPGLLINFATMLQGMSVFRGIRVVDFGSGSGWTSRFLTQLGCEVILLDVSKTALEMSAALYAQSPVIGPHIAPQFLLFDGHRIDVPDESVDRILCFDAFHHAPNPNEVLAEFARILKPGGIAAFAEPGPHHSKTAQSQFEMKTYGVLESDIDIRAIWNTAQQLGFSDIKVMAYNVPPFEVSLDAYEDLLRGGETYLRWAESTRAFLGNVRNFFLYRAGTPRLDSRQRTGLSCTIEAPPALSGVANRPTSFQATVRNSGSATWLSSPEEFGGVSLGVHLFDAAGRLMEFDFHWQPLTTEKQQVEPDGQVVVTVDLPPLAAGSYVVELDAVANHVTWFAQVGSKSTRLHLDVADEPTS